MAIRIIYDQTLPATGNGDSAGWIKVLDVTQLVAGCTGFIYDHDTGPIGVRVEAIDSPNSKLQLSILQSTGSYLVSSLVAYTVAGGTSVKIPQQAREDAGYVPPAGGAIAGLVAGGSTAGSGFVTFADSNGVTFGMSNNILTASVQTAGGGGNLALSAGNYSTNSGTVLFRNSNGMSFGMDTNGEITGAYTVPDISQINFSNSNNVTFGVNGWTVTATASFTQTVQTQGLVNIEGSTGTIHFSNANGVSFGGNNNTITASVVIPPQTVQTQNLVSIKGSTGNIFFDNANGLTFGGNNSTITASYTVPVVPAQTVQPVAASASNGSFNFSTLGFNQGGGVTFSTNVNGINAIVKTDYQSSNANYLTSQSNQAVSGSNGSFAFQTLSLGASNGASFYTTNGSVVVSYTVPSVPAQTYQPVAVSGSNGSFTASTLSFGQSNGVTFYTTNGSLVASYTVPAIPGATVFSNSNNVSFGLNGSTITASATFAGGGAAISAAGGSQNTGTVIFSNSNGISFGYNAGTITATVNPGAAAGIAAQGAGTQTATSGTVNFINSNNVSFGMTNSSQITASASFAQSTQPVAISGSNGSSTFATLTMGNSNGLTHYMTNGSLVGSYTVPGATVFSNSNNVTFGLNGSTVTASVTVTYPAQTVQPVAASASNGSFNFSTLRFVEGSGVTWATQVNGIQASVKTDYQSSNANYLTSQSNQAFSASGGSSAFQTLVFANSNGVTFTNTNGSLAMSYTVPGATVFSNSNNVSFGLNGSTVTATATFPAQTVQPVAASASNGSFNFSTLRFSEGGGVTWSTNANGINATVKTDYQSSNANYLTSQSNQALSGSNGSFAFQTASFGNSNGATFYTTNGSMVVSYTVPGATVFSNSNNVSFGLNGSTVTATATFPAQTVQPVAASGSNGSFAFSTISFGASNGATFYTTNGSIVASYTVPSIPGATVFSNSNNVSFGLNGSTVTATATFPAQTIQPVAASGSNGSFQFSTMSFGQSNGATFYTTNGSIVVSYTVPTQSVQPVAVSGSNGSFAFSTLTMGNSNGLTFYTTNGSMVGSYTVPVIPGATVFSNSNNVTFGLNGSTVTASVTVTYPAQTVQPVAASASNGSFNFSTLKFVEGSGVTWATQANGIQASVKTDYQSSNANYLTSQSNQAFSAVGGSSAFQTLAFANSQGVSFSNSNGSLVASVKTDYQSSNANYLTSQSTGPAAIAVPGTTVSSGTIIFSNSNGVSFGYGTGTATNIITVTVQPGAAAGIAAFSAGTEQATSGTVQFINSNGVTFGMNTGASAGQITASIQPAAASGVGAIIAGTQTVSSGSVTFSNSNNISFGLGSGASASILTASASFNQTVQPVAVSGSNGSFAFSTLTMGASNGLTFYTTNGSVVGSYTVPTVPGATVFSNSNNVSFGLNGSTVTATATFPAQTVQPVAASASNGSFNFSTLKFVEGSGVTWATQAGGIQASVKTDYQSSNANYLTSQSNQAFSASGGSSAFQTLNFANSNNVTFSNSNGSVVASASFPAQTVQPVALSGSNGSFNFSTASFGASNGATFYTTNGSMVVSYTVPSVPGATVFSNSNNVSFGLNGSTVTATATWPAQSVQPVAASGSNGSFQFSTLTFGASNGATFYTTNNSMVVSYTVPTQSTQAVAASGSNGSFTFSTLTLGSSNGMHFYTTNGSVVGSYTQPALTQLAAGTNITLTSNGSTISIVGPVFSNSNNVTFGANAGTITASATFAQTTQPVAVSGSNGSFAFSTLTLGSSNGMHFYTTNGSVVGSYTVPSIPGATVFSNSNNVSFGLNGSTVTATATFAQTNQTLGLYAVGTTTGASSSSTVDARSFSIQGAGNISVGLTNGSFVISQTGGAGGATSGGGYLQGNTTGQSSSSTYALSSFNVSGAGNVSVGWSNSSMIISGGGGAGGAALKGSGTYSQNTGTVEFANSNGVTFGLSNNGTMTASFAQSQITGGTNITLSSNGSTVSVIGPTFSNSNNVTFGVNGQTITASATFAPFLGLYAIGNTTGNNSSDTFDARSVTMSGAGNVSVGWSNDSFIISGAGGGGGAAVGISTAGNTQGTSGNFSNGTYIFEGSNGLSVSQLTAATPGVQTLRLVAPTQTAYVFSNSNGVSFGTNGSTVTATVATTYAASNHTHGSGPSITGSISVTSASNAWSISIPAFLTTAMASNRGSDFMSASQSNNYFYTSNNTFANSTHSHGNPTLALTNITGTTASASNGFTLSLSAAGAGAVNQTGPNIADGNGNTVTSGTVVFSNSNGVSFGLNGSIMTASAAGGGQLTVSAGNGSYATGVLSFADTLGHSWSTGTQGIYVASDEDPAVYTQFTYQNRQLGASTQSAPGNNSVWLVPMRIAAPVSASTLMQLVSLTGTATSNQTNTIGITLDAMLYKVTQTTNISRFDSIWSGRMGLTLWNSGTVSGSYSISGPQNTSGSSAGSVLIASSIYGVRQVLHTIGSELGTGMYGYGFRMSTSSAGQSSLLRTLGMVMDNPMPLGQNVFGAQTNQSIGYNDGGTYATTSTAMPASFVFSQIRQTNNVMPYVKIGAL